MKIAVIGAMISEIEELVHKTSANVSDNIFGTNSYYKKIENIDLHIFECGIGKVNASAITQLIITKYKPDLIINSGVAGSLKEHNKIGDIIIGNEITHHDVRPEQMENCFPFQKSFFCNDEWIAKTLNACKKSIRNNIVVGTIVSGEDFINSTNRKNEIQNKYNADCVDMESSAIAHVAFINNIPFIIIRTICDNANEISHIDFEEFEKENAKISSECIVELMKEINTKIT